MPASNWLAGVWVWGSARAFFSMVEVTTDVPRGLHGHQRAERLRFPASVFGGSQTVPVLRFARLRRPPGARECSGLGDKPPWRDRRRERLPADAWRGPVVRK